MTEITTPLLVGLNAEEREALARARAQHRDGSLSEAQFARLLIRDGLIAMGILALPRANRGRRAGR